MHGYLMSKNSLFPEHKSGIHFVESHSNSSLKRNRDDRLSAWLFILGVVFLCLN